LYNSIVKIFGNAVIFYKRNETLIFFIVVALIFLRFIWLNVVNWQTGYISNGEPGLKYWLDSGRYISGAEKLISGGDFIDRENQYLGYMAVLAALKLTGLSLVWIVVIQILVAILAAAALFDSAIKFGVGKISALVAVALFLCNPFIVQWHQYVLTESLYTSFVILFLWSIIRIYYQTNSKNILLSAAILVFTLLLRPNGWILLPVFVIFLILCFKLNMRNKVLLAVGIFLAFFVGIVSIGTLSDAVKITAPAKNMQDGVTVWQHHELYLDMPKEPDLYSDNLQDGFRYCLRHPDSVLKLGITRAGYTLVHIRPYHSIKYKMRVLFWVLPAYLLAIFGIICKRKYKITYAALMVIIAHLLVVALTYAEHDSRFDIYILPVFYLLAAAGVESVISLLRNRNCGN
jgi:Gpi18-like mannosyltransferase